MKASKKSRYTSTGALWGVLMTLTMAVMLMSPPVNAKGNPHWPAPTCENSNCHGDLESIAEPGSAMAGVSCVQCHKGDDTEKNKKFAHAGMYSNPADLRVADETCGNSACHADYVEKSKKSLHATTAGIISGARWDWGAQDTKNAIFATRDICDDDGDIGGLECLYKVPHYDPNSGEAMTNTADPVNDPGNSPVDDYLRNQCLRCHLWSGGHERTGDYRASGCASCHMVYDNDGLYKGNDDDIPSNEPGHPRMHRITNKIPESQCEHCHNRGARIGVSFTGKMESDGYGTPSTDTGGKQPQLHGKNYNHLQPDIHLEKGMTCIDCHGTIDLHGDGNIQSKKEEAVGIDCTNCHGTLTARATGLDERGNPIPNLSVDGVVTLTTKMDGIELHPVQIVDIDPATPAGIAMKGISEHLDFGGGNGTKLECYTCHSKWVPQCYGCHAKQDLRTAGRDWIDPVENTDDPSKTALKSAADASAAAYSWSESRSYLRWETPTLGINSDVQGNNVSPFTTGCQVIFTQIGLDGKATQGNLNRIFTAADGFSGVAHNPLSPHTVTDKPRRCEDCHNTDKALGLGFGVYRPAANGIDTAASGIGVEFELEQIVTEKGEQLQTTNHVGARPLNSAEMEHMKMDQTCSDCHANGIP